MFHHVGQLPDIARPFVLQEHVHGFGSQQLLYLFDGPTGRSTQQKTSQGWNVRPPFAKSRQANLKRVDAKVKVLAELVFLDQSPEVAVGGAENANVRAEGLGLAYPANFARF